MREVYADEKKELDGYDAEFKRLITGDLARLYDTAKRLDFPFVIMTEGLKNN